MVVYKNIFEKADKNYSSTTESLESIVKDFNLDELVKEITNDTEWLRFICSKSYSHSNGFDKLTLFRGSNLRVRLHIYWLNNKNKNPNIHDHRWNFSSFIIKGGYKSEIYEISDVGTNKFLYHYYSQASNKENYELDFIKKVKLAHIETKEYTENNINTGKAGDIHRIILNDKKLTVSLFITSNYENNYARVLTNDAKLKGEKLNSTSLSRKEVIKKLKSIL